MIFPNKKPLKAFLFFEIYSQIYSAICGQNSFLSVWPATDRLIVVFTNEREREKEEKVSIWRANKTFSIDVTTKLVSACLKQFIHYYLLDWTTKICFYFQITNLRETRKVKSNHLNYTKWIWRIDKPKQILKMWLCWPLLNYFRLLNS